MTVPELDARLREWPAGGYRGVLFKSGELRVGYALERVVIPPKIRMAERWNFFHRQVSTKMKKSRFTDSQIMDALERVESGISVPDMCRELGISTAMLNK